MFISSQNYEYNTQSTYLYYLLNGFSISDINDIKWVDSQRVLSTPIERTRQNVYLSENEWVYKKQVQMQT